METNGLMLNSEQAELNRRARSARCVINPIALTTALICCAIPPLCIALAFNKRDLTTPIGMVIVGIILAILGFVVGVFIGAQIGLMCARYLCDFTKEEIKAIGELPPEYDYRGRRVIC